MNTKITKLNQIVLKSHQQPNQYVTLALKINHYVKNYSQGLDFGSGSGFLANNLININTGLKIDCVEIDKKLRDQTSKQFNVYKDIKDCKKKYEFIYSSNVLEHIKDDNEIIKEISNSLKKNGLLVLHLPAHQYLYSSFDKDVGHYRRYSKKGVTKLLSDTYEIKYIEYEDFVGYLISLCLKALNSVGINLKSYNQSLNNYDKYLYPLNKIFRKMLLQKFIGKNIFVVAEKII